MSGRGTHPSVSEIEAPLPLDGAGAGDASDVSVELPLALSGIGRLHLWPRGRGGCERFRTALNGAGFHFEVDLDEHRLTVPVGPRSFADVLVTLRDRLAAADLQHARVILKSDDTALTRADFARADRLSSFVALSRGCWLSDILRERRLSVVFQPIVDAQTLDDIHGYEALLRGVDRSHGPIEPGRMLSAARDAGLLPELDHQLHDMAASLFALFERHQRLFINMTPTTACHPELGLDGLRAALGRWELDPGRVVIELTECEQAPDGQALRDLVAHTHEVGFQFALDDLGAGYSNLNLIHELKPDIIKLDMALVRDIHRDHVKAAIAETIIGMAKHLGISTVAEGIEQIEEFAWVRERGVEYAQGFLLGRPQAGPDPATGRWPARAHDPYEDLDTLTLEQPI